MDKTNKLSSSLMLIRKLCIICLVLIQQQQILISYNNLFFCHAYVININKALLIPSYKSRYNTNNSHKQRKKSELFLSSTTSKLNKNNNQNVKSNDDNNENIVSIIKSFGLLHHSMNILIPNHDNNNEVTTTAATTASNNNMNNIIIGEIYTNGNIHFGILVNITTTPKTKLHVILLDQFVLDENDDKYEQNNWIINIFDISQIVSLWSTTTSTSTSNKDINTNTINKITIPSTFILKSISSIYKECKDQLSLYPSEKAMQTLYKSRIGRGRSNVATKKEIKNISEQENIQMLLRTSLKAGKDMKRLIRSYDIAYPYLFTMAEADDIDVWKQMEHRMISSLIINNDILYGGRFKRFPSLLVYNTDTNICIINGGYITLDSSTKIITETNKFIQHNTLNNNDQTTTTTTNEKTTSTSTTTTSTAADERIYYRLECFAMLNNNTDIKLKNIELDVKTVLSTLNLPISPSGAKLALLQMGKWSQSTSNDKNSIQPWSNDIINASKLFIAKRQQKQIVQDIDNDRIDLSKLPSVCIDTKNISFRDDAIGIRPRKITKRNILPNAYPYELLLHITDVSDIFCANDGDEHGNNVLLNAAASRGFSRYDLPLGPLHLLPVNVLKELSLQYSIKYDNDNNNHDPTLSWKDLLLDNQKNKKNKCLTVWIYIDKNSGQLLDYGIERTYISLPIALNFNIATKLLLDKQQGVEQENKLTKDLSAILTIMNNMLLSWNNYQLSSQTSSSTTSTSATTKKNNKNQMVIQNNNKKRQEKLRIKELISEQMNINNNNRNRNKFEYTTSHQLIDNSLELYSHIIKQLFIKKRSVDKKIYPLPYNNMLKSSSSSDSRLGTAPLRRYIDGMIQRQILSVFFSKYYNKFILNIDDCKLVTKITMDTFAIQKNLSSLRTTTDSSSSNANNSMNKTQFNTLRTLEQHLAATSSSSKRLVKAMATGRLPNEVVIVNIGAIAKCKGIKGTLKPGEVITCKVLKLVPDKGILSIQFVENDT